MYEESLPLTYSDECQSGCKWFNYTTVELCLFSVSTMRLNAHLFCPLFCDNTNPQQIIQQLSLSIYILKTFAFIMPFNLYLCLCVQTGCPGRVGDPS